MIGPPISSKTTEKKNTRRANSTVLCLFTKASSTRFRTNIITELVSKTKNVKK